MGILRWLSSRLGGKPKPVQLHMLKWHPLFYKAVKVHIMETTGRRRNLV